VVARVVPAARGLRGHRAYRALRRALHLSLSRTDFRIVSLALCAHRLELVVEADDRVALARGMQGFQVAAAKHLNHSLGRRGAVFPDRYRARRLLSRAAVRAITGPWRTVARPIRWLLEELVAGQRPFTRPPDRGARRSIDADNHRR
jgi:hypothetical protein